MRGSFHNVRKGYPLVGVDQLTEIMETAFASTQLIGEKAVSLILISEPDSGKSQIVMSYTTPHSVVVSDMTSKGLHHVISTHPQPLVLVIPDLNATLSHKPTVSGSTIANLLSLMEEGTMTTADAGAVLDFKGAKVSIIGCMTPGMVKEKRGKWRRIGFLRRFVPIAYTYTEATEDAIHRAIREGKYTQPKTRLLSLPKEPKKVSISLTMAKQIEELSRPYAEVVESRGFTLHKMGRSYVMARALLEGRRAVNGSDFEHFKGMLQFVNIDKPHAI